MRLHCAGACAAVLILLFIPGCGGNGLPRSRDVVLAIEPATPTVAANGAITLTGSATGFTGGTVVNWWIQESHDKDPYDDCGLLAEQAPPTAQRCPYGYVMFATVDGLPNQAQYHAPSTPGTYHVTLRAVQPVEFDYLAKTLTVPITVTP